MGASLCQFVNWPQTSDHSFWASIMITAITPAVKSNPIATKMFVSQTGSVIIILSKPIFSFSKPAGKINGILRTNKVIGRVWITQVKIVKKFVQ